MINEEVSKYHDLQIITEKIRERGFYDQLLETLMGMFREECVFTYTELERILKQQNDEGSIFEQFWINTEVFRSNLILILTSMGRLELTVVNSIWRSEDLVKQMLDEGILSAENRPSDPTSSIRENIARKEYNSTFNERNTKSRSGARNNATATATVEQPRGKTTITVAKPEEYCPDEYDFVSSKKPSAYKYGDRDEIETSFKQASTKSARKVQPNNQTSGRPQTQANVSKNYFDSNKRVVANNPTPVEEADTRGRSRSIDRSTAGRPRSANRDRSRDYASTYSHYSSVYSRILNSSEVNKIKKLVGPNNADLDVFILLP